MFPAVFLYIQQDGRKIAQRSEPNSARGSRIQSERPPPGKYTFQTNQLPRPQYPAVKHIDSTKSNKQVSIDIEKLFIKAKSDAG